MDLSLGRVSGPIFAEASEGRALNLFLALAFKPTSSLRFEGQWPHQVITRASDGSWFSTANIPRLKVEYQLTRDIFFRYVGQYFAQVRDTLRDPRTGDQLIVNGTPQGRSTNTEFRNDFLFSYKPTPGTVLFFGYGSSLSEPHPFSFRRLSPTGGAFEPWYAQLNLVVGCLLISAVLFAMGLNGHVLYGAYIIAPLQAALYLERREAWGALIINLAAFTLVTALAQVAGHGWVWSLYIQESLVLVFVCVALVPMLVQIVDRLRTARGVLGEIERGDLTRQMESGAANAATDELGFLGVSVNRTTAAIADIIREIGRQGGALATMAGELATSARELQAASQSISNTTHQLSEGTERQRQLIGYGRQDSEAASGLATTLHARAGGRAADHGDRGPGAQT